MMLGVLAMRSYGERNCVVCGNIFKAKCSTHRFCSHKCYLKGMRPRKPELKMQCRLCGAPFVTHRPTQIYCSELCQHHSNHYWLKYDILSAYSSDPPHCMCECGDKRENIAILDLHHTEHNGANARKIYGDGGGYYIWIKNNNYPLGYTVLCVLCHRRHHAFGFCRGDNYEYPHALKWENK
jgi:endogenous inhibitor of DNA gyrase (YacG/DUF329 family)